MNIKIMAEKRNLGKKSDLTVLRKEGFIPGIIYGAGQEGIKIAFNARDYTREYKKSIGAVAFFDITVDGKTYKECSGTLYEPVYQNDQVQYKIVESPK